MRPRGRDATRIELQTRRLQFRANTGIFVCTALLIAIVVAGSLGVTHNANANMMPTHMSVQRALSKG